MNLKKWPAACWEKVSGLLRLLGILPAAPKPPEDFLNDVLGAGAVKQFDVVCYTLAPGLFVVGSGCDYKVYWRVELWSSKVPSNWQTLSRTAGLLQERGFAYLEIPYIQAPCLTDAIDLVRRCFAIDDQRRPSELPRSVYNN